MKVDQVLADLEKRGIRLRLVAGKVKIRFADRHQVEELASQITFLRSRRAEVRAILRRRDQSMYFWGRHGDYYGWRLNLTFERISRPDYPAGLVPWLGTQVPRLYDLLTRSLPDQISDAWNQNVSPEVFEGLCHELENVHAHAINVYWARANASVDKILPKDTGDTSP